MEAIKVKFEGGVFKPLERVESVKEGQIGEVYIRKGKRKKRSIKSSKFFGLWKNREDIKDGLTYVRELRSKSRY